DFRFGQPVIGDFPCPPPCGFVSLAASFKRSPPDFSHTASERHECRHVCRHGVIGEETPDHLLKPLPLLGYGIMSSPAQLLLDFLEPRTAAVAPGCRRKIEMSPGAQSRDDTPVGDGAEERAGLHLAVRLSSAFDCRAGSGLRYYCR